MDSLLRHGKRIWAKFRGLNKFLQIFILVFIGLVLIAAYTDPPEDYGDRQAQAQRAEEQAEAEAAEEKRRDNSIDEDDYYNLKDLAKQAVSERLVAPSTAKFQGGIVEPFNGWGFTIEAENRVRLSSIVDAQNSFGAMIRNEFIMRACQVDGTYHAIDLNLQGEMFQYDNPCP